MLLYTHKSKESVVDLNEREQRQKLNITLPPKLIINLDKVKTKYGINKSKQIETLISKYLNEEYGNLE